MVEACVSSCYNITFNIQQLNKSFNLKRIWLLGKSHTLIFSQAPEWKTPVLYSQKTHAAISGPDPKINHHLCTAAAAAEYLGRGGSQIKKNPVTSHPGGLSEGATCPSADRPRLQMAGAGPAGGHTGTWQHSKAAHYRATVHPQVGPTGQRWKKTNGEPPKS